MFIIPELLIQVYYPRIINSGLLIQAIKEIK